MASSLVLLIYSIDYDMMCFKGLLIPPPQPVLALLSLLFDKTGSSRIATIKSV